MMDHDDIILWNYFLALEKQLLATEYYAEFSENNNGCYSLAYRSIILQACSDIEIILKKICNFNPSDKTTMKNYRDYINDKHSDFHTIEVKITLWKYNETPWKKLAEEKCPDFWKGYTAIKHGGAINKATQINAVNALAGHFSILIAYFTKHYGENFADNNISQPLLFSYYNLFSANVIARIHPLIVPGFN